MENAIPLPLKSLFLLLDIDPGSAIQAYSGRPGLFSNLNHSHVLLLFFIGKIAATFCFRTNASHAVVFLSSMFVFNGMESNAKNMGNMLFTSSHSDPSNYIQ